MVNAEERRTFFVKARHILTLRTTRNYNGVIYQQADGKFILQYSMNGRFGSTDGGIYITEAVANEMIEKDKSGDIMDELINYYAN